MPGPVLGLGPGPRPRPGPGPGPGPGAELENVVEKPETEGELRVLRRIDCKVPAVCCCFNQSGQLLAVGLMTGNIKLYKPCSGAFVYQLRDTETLNINLPVTSLNFCPPGAASGDLLLATYASGKVKLWHVSTQKCLHTLVENQETLAAAFNASGTRFATAGTAASIRLYDTASRDCLQTFTPSPSPTVMDGHRSRIFVVKFNPHNLTELLSGGWDDTVQFWTENHPHSLRRIFGPHLCGDSLQIHPVSDEILTGSWRREKSLEVWDYQSGEKIQDIPQKDGDYSLTYSCRWLGPDHVIAAGTRNNICRLVHRETMATVGRLGNLSQGVYSIDVCTDQSDKSLVAVCSESYVYLLDHQQA
ncbi:uncharacterized WD repeat-containing protein alr3466-like [Hemiscyllium ocellatum]|uniref:uncharacterized WD repeat-containing protein alr3466-like n=1 Tax=Hemiscyllium ocellatum TaxID=170820 RepID=UPI0029671731|nr:uncharacterized WD repeat-containing protein alr3466-like [Hemiscyllium ocellatum]